MEVILLEKMRNLGVLGDKVNVKSGYARNFLIPKGKAVYANDNNIAKFELRRAELEKIAAANFKLVEEKQAAINALPLLTIAAKAGDEGKLFGSVGSRDIADAIIAAGVEIEKRDVSLPDGPFRALGQHEVTIDLDTELKATVKINIVPLS